ncbi:hypothetical protein AB0E63_12820 [Kribbella sp. NPDC026596]|uniref:hypothetical protein n=1 Tax=Kribbella sp. NPDC026596 TaxID=3155122 RepID=UPI0033F5DE51
MTESTAKTPEQLDRLRRRAAFLRELEEARALRDRIAPAGPGSGNSVRPCAERRIITDR